MKKILALILGAVMCMSLLAACGEAEEPALSGAELAAHYKEAITAGRSDADNADRPIYITGEEEEMGSIVWDLLGLKAEDLDAYALSVSLMNTQAYCVGLFKPVEGREEAVTSALQTYVEGTQKSFESYLPDQGEIANNAILKTLDDGTVMLVMSEGWDEVAEGITAAL